MSTLLVPLSLLVTWAVVPDVWFLVLHRLIGPTDRQGRRQLFLLSRGAGPVAMATLTYALLRFVPHRGSGLYLTIGIGAILALLAVGRRECPALLLSYREAATDLRSILRRARSSAPLLVTVCLSVIGFVVGIAFPMVEHDALAAGIEARIMFRDEGVKVYMDGTPDPESGYNMQTFRTPFLQTLYVWMGLFGGASSMDLLSRTVSPFYGSLTLLLIAWIVNRRWGERAAVWAAFLLAATPIFFYMSYNNGIDTPRFFLMSAAVISFAELAEGRAGLARVALAGALSGLALYGHMLSMVALVGAGTGYLLFGQRSLLDRSRAVALTVFVAFLFGAQYHYLSNPRIVETFRESVRADFFRDLFAVGGDDENISAAEAFADVLELRGQRGGPLSHLLFGRLQMFTGIEYFGLAFVVALAGVLVWSRSPDRRRADWVFLGALVTVTYVVVAGLRVLSWSNPRYIASVLPLVAYFWGPTLVSVESFLSRRIRRTRFSPVAAWAMVLVLFCPSLLVTSIRGAKVEITNPGTFYQDFRSLAWAAYAVKQPGDALARFWNDYFGIRRTIRYLFSDSETKRRHSHDYFAGVQYINEATSDSAKVLVFRATRFFYYGERYGVVWNSSEIDEGLPLRELWTAAELSDYLCSENFSHILLDTYSTKLRGYTSSNISILLDDPLFVSRDFLYGTASVYSLRCDWRL